MQIIFYDVSSSQHLSRLNGQSLRLEDLYGLRVANGHQEPLPLAREQLCTLNFHPYGGGESGWRRWASYFSVAAFLVSGNLPNQEEVQLAKGLIMRLPREFKEQHVDHVFVMCFLPYLLSGFKLHRNDVFVPDSNAITEARTFVQELFGVERVLFTSFLCAHRDPKIDDSLNLLQSFIPEGKIKSAASIVLGLSHNAHPRLRGRAIFMQQGLSDYATSSIFPEVVLEYLQGGRVYEMIDRLRYQYELIGRILREIQGDRVNARLVTLDVLNRRLERFLAERFGSEWHMYDFTQMQGDPLVGIAVESVLPSIKRMMPFFSEGFRARLEGIEHDLLVRNHDAAMRAGGRETAELSDRVVRRFMSKHRMSASAKAVYEASFYFLWGKYCASSEAVFAIGFDRDHEAYQHDAWTLGASVTAGMRQTALLYARRNPNGEGHHALSSLSYRQFWR